MNKKLITLIESALNKIEAIERDNELKEYRKNPLEKEVQVERQKILDEYENLSNTVEEYEKETNEKALFKLKKKLDESMTFYKEKEKELPEIAEKLIKKQQIGYKLGEIDNPNREEKIKSFFPKILKEYLLREIEYAKDILSGIYNSDKKIKDKWGVTASKLRRKRLKGE